jgi:glycosyltransferase involved in cell wall biosynthesis
VSVPVSVLMPVYNAERYIGAAIDSILGQTHRDFELLVVDDGSTDKSRQIAERYSDERIRVIPLGRRAGLSAALNEGLLAAKADLVARQDADDISEPNRLERQLAVMRAQPELALLGSQATAMAEDGSTTGIVWRPIEPLSIRWYSLLDNPFAHTSGVCKTQVVRDLGGFDADYDPFSQDYALWCRVIAHYSFANLRDPLVRYRVNAASIIGSLNGAADDGYRRRFHAIVREIVGTQVRRMMPETLQASDVELLAGFVPGVNAGDLDRFLSLFERLLAAFLKQHPGAMDVPDFRETLARQFDAVAFRVRPPSRRSAAAVYLHALRRHPGLAAYLSWARALALVALGRSGREQVAGWLR